MKKALLYACLILLVSCENDMEVIRSLTEEKIHADLSGEMVEVIQTDSSRMKMKLLAKKLLKFQNNEDPYYEFPEGLDVYTYDNDKNVSTEVHAEYGKYYTAKRLWHLKYNVVAKNVKKEEQLESNEFFWDEVQRKVFSSLPVKIINKSGTFYGEKGFEADQDMNYWKLIGSKGTMNVKDKSENSEQEESTDQQ